MEEQIRTALGRFQEDLWIQRRLKLDEVSLALDKLQKTSRNLNKQDRETLADWTRFVQFLDDHCSGLQFTSDRQWSELMNLMSISRKVNHLSVRFKDIIKNKQLIEANSKNIRQLNQSAVLVQTIQSSLKEIEANLRACELDFWPDKQDDDDDLVGKVLDNQVRYLQNNCWPILRTVMLELNNKLVGANAHLEQWKLSARYLENSLRNLSDFLDNFGHLERPLRQLRPLVMSLADRTAVGDSSQQLTGNRERQLDDSLNLCKANFRQLLGFRDTLMTNLKRQKGNKSLAVMKLLNPKTGDFVEGDLFVVKLRQNVQRSRECRQMLDRLMSSLRLEFGRFYFVNNLELLTIISLDSKLISDCHLEQNRHLIGKLFNDSISSFQLSHSPGQVTTITGVKSSLGELVPLVGEDPVPLRKRVNVYSVEIVRILNEVMRKLRRSLRRLLRRHLSDGHPPESTFWSSTLPIQLANLAEQVSFTEQVEKNLDNLARLLEFYELRFRQLGENGDLRKDQLRRSAALSVSVQFISCIMKLQLQQVRSVHDWNWQKLARYYLVKAGAVDGIHHDDDWQLEVRLANAKFHYKFDYLAVQVDKTSQSLYKRLISTQTSDRCFLVASQAVGRLKLGASPFGPAGSGKTETIKALGHALGCQVVVHNCDESNEPEALDRLVWGLAHTGLWGCFDEFNRLASSTLSSVSATLELIQTSLREDNLLRTVAPATSAPDGQVAALNGSLQEQQVVSIDPASAFFVTLNPGDELRYRGRRQLPANLRSLFLPISMVRVEMEPIVSESLLAFGAGQTANTQVLVEVKATDAGRVGRLLAQWLEWMRQQQVAGSSNRCEWDLRLVMAVLRRLKMLLGESTGGKDDHQQQLDELLVQAIRCELEGRLGADERPLLHESLQQLVPTWRADSACEPPERQLQLQLQTRPGVILLGPTGSGKSTCWRGLLNNNNKQVRWFALNPKSCNKDHLFGYYSNDQQSRKWNDGQFTKLVRESLDLLRSSQEDLGEVWIILDGGIDPDWIESLNSALDDNQVLTLSSGERLNMFVASGSTNKSIKLLFETSSVEFASPATISRLGLVYFEKRQPVGGLQPTGAPGEPRLSKEDSSDDDKLLKSFLAGKTNTQRLLLISGTCCKNHSLKQNLKIHKQSYLEYNCSQLTNSSHLLDLLSRQTVDVLVVSNVNLIQEEEDKWHTRSFLELVRFILTYDCYYDSNLRLTECNKLKFILCLDTLDGFYARLNSLAVNYIKTEEELERPASMQQVVDEEALFGLISGERDNNNDDDGHVSSIISVKTTGCNELPQGKQTNLVSFANSHQIRLAMETMRKLLQREASSSPRQVFAVNELQLSLMDDDQRRRLFHLLNLFRQANTSSSRFVYLSTFSTKGSEKELQFWSSMGPVYCMKPAKQVAALDELNKQSNLRDANWLLEKVHEIASRHDGNSDKLLQAFLAIHRHSQENLSHLRSSLKGGLECLERFEQSVQRIKEQRADDDRRLDEEKQTIETFIGQLNEKLTLARDQKEKATRLKELEASKTSQVASKQANIQAELAKVVPLIEASQVEVKNCLKPEALNEIKTLRAPPKTIKDILDVLFLLLGQPDSSWASIKTYLARYSLRDELSNYDFKSRLNPGLINRLEAEMSRRADSFELQQATRASSAIVPVLRWIQATLQYGKVIIKLKPLQAELERLQNESESVKKSMETIEREQVEIEEKIQVDSSKLQESRLHFEQAERNSQKVRKDLDEAQKIRKNVASQANRWRKRLELLAEFEGPAMERYCLLATCLALHCFRPGRQDHLSEFAALLNIKEKDDKQLVARILSLINADDSFDLSLIGTADELQHVSQLVALHILTCLDCKTLPFLDVGQDRDDDGDGTSRDELAAYLSFKNSPLLQAQGEPKGALVFIKVSSVNNASELLERSLKQVNKLVLVELDSTWSSSSSSSCGGSGNDNLDIMDVLTRANKARVVLVGRLGRLNDQVSSLIRPISMQTTQMAAGQLDEQQTRLTDRLLDVLVSLADPKLKEATCLVEQQIRDKQGEFKTIEQSLLSRLALSEPNNQPVASLDKHYELIKVLNESYEWHSKLELGLQEMRAKLAEFAAKRGAFDDLAQRAASFYVKCLHKHQSNGFVRVTLHRFAEMVHKLSIPGPANSEAHLEALLAHLMRPMQTADRNRFVEDLLGPARQEFDRFLGSFAKRDHLEQVTRAANERAANLRLCLEEQLAELVEDNHRTARLVVVMHDWRRSSPQVELDELMRRQQVSSSLSSLAADDGEQNKSACLSYHKLYATAERTTTRAPDSDVIVDESSQSTPSSPSSSSSSGQLESNLIKILTLPASKGKFEPNKQQVRVVCIANAHLASNWLSSRLLQLVDATLNAANNNPARFLIILVAEAPSTGSARCQEQVFGGGLLDGALAKCWHDELSLQLAERFNLLINLINYDNKQTPLSSANKQSPASLIGGLVLFHVVCQELTRPPVERPDGETTPIGWHSNTYTFDYNQLSVAVKMLQQLLQDQDKERSSMEQVRSLWCHQLENIVYGSRMESRQDEVRLRQLIDQLLGSMDLISNRLAKISTNKRIRLADLID